MDAITTNVPVWRPPAGQAAASFWAVRLRMRTIRRARVSCGWTAVAIAGLSVIGYVVEDPVTAAVFDAVAVALGILAVVLHRRYGRFEGRIDDLVSMPLTRTPAAFVGEDVLALADYRVRVHGANWAVRQVVARTGEVATAGPDATGLMLVLVDGRPTPIPAELVTTFDTPRETPRGTDVTGRYARWLVETMWVATAAFVVLGTGWTINQATTTHFGWIMSAVFFAVALVVMGIRAIRLTVALRQVGNYQWEAHPVTVHRWRGDPAVVGNLHLLLNDREGLPLTVRMATVELVATIQMTNQVWVAGPPEAGKITAVGVPGYPIFAEGVYRKVS